MTPDASRRFRPSSIKVGVVGHPTPGVRSSLADPLFDISEHLTADRGELRHVDVVVVCELDLNRPTLSDVGNALGSTDRPVVLCTEGHADNLRALASARRLAGLILVSPGGPFALKSRSEDIFIRRERDIVTRP